jgi:hypothetical protein
MSTLAAAAHAMSEAYLDNQVWNIVRDLGLRRYHTFNSKKSDKGWPDLVICGPGGILYRELKRESESPTKAQREWLEALRAAGADAAVWRPGDLLHGDVARELTAISGHSRNVPVPAEQQGSPAGAGISGETT